MNTTESNKYTAVRALSKVRGIKEFREEQKETIQALCCIEELSPKDILDEVMDAPQERMDRTVTAIRTQGSRFFSTIAAVLKP